MPRKATLKNQDHVDYLKRQHDAVMEHFKIHPEFKGKKDIRHMLRDIDYLERVNQADRMNKGTKHK